MNRRPAALTAGWLLTFPSRGGWVGRGGLLCDHPSRLAPRGGELTRPHCRWITGTRQSSMYPRSCLGARLGVGASKKRRRRQ